MRSLNPTSKRAGQDNSRSRPRPQSGGLTPPGGAELQERLHVLDGSAQDGARASLYDGTLNQVRVFDHQRDQLVVRKLAHAQTKLFVDGLAPAQDVARL